LYLAVEALQKFVDIVREVGCRARVEFQNGRLHTFLVDPYGAQTHERRGYHGKKYKNDNEFSE